MTETDHTLRTLEELVPAIRARREEIEKARRLPDDLVEDLRRTRVFAFEVPRALGGLEAEPLQVLEAIEIAARGDGSVGWCVMAGMTGNLASGFSAEEGAREVFRDPTIATAGIFAPAGAAVFEDGGVRVSGRWPFASGIMHSPWLWVGCVVMEGGAPKMTPMGPEVIHVWLPVSAVEIHDTWFVSGLCGTGSHDVSARDVFVPSSRIFRVADPAGHRPEMLYRMPITWYVPQLASVSLGVARAALDEIAALAQTRMPTMSTLPLADRPAAQVELARAEANVGAARAFLRQAVGDLWKTTQAGKPITPRQLAASRVASLLAAESSAAATRAASVLAGGGAIHAASSLQRHMRDADAIAHHFVVSPHVWEDAGRVYLGRAPVTPLF